MCFVLSSGLGQGYTGFCLSWLVSSCNLLMKWSKVKKKDRFALISDFPSLCISEVFLSLWFCQVVSPCLPHIMRKKSVFTVFVLVQVRGGAEGSFVLFSLIAVLFCSCLVVACVVSCDVVSCRAVSYRVLSCLVLSCPNYRHSLHPWWVQLSPLKVRGLGLGLGLG